MIIIVTILFSMVLRLKDLTMESHLGWDHSLFLSVFIRL